MRIGLSLWIYSSLLMITLFLLTNSCKKNEPDINLRETGVIFNPELQYDSVFDIDGNTYKTIVIGTQTWMAENLKTTKYRDGSSIGTTSPSTLNISESSTPKYYWVYEGDVSKVGAYGMLYTGFAVTDSRNICPTGWHIPTDEEWTILTDFLGGTSVAGRKLKEIGSTHWSKPPSDLVINIANESGFTALPGGYRGGDYFKMLRYQGCWWSSSEGEYGSWFIYIHYASDRIDRNQENQISGLSVRCIKD